MNKVLFDILPIIIFFITYKLYDIYVATITLIITSAVQLMYKAICYRKISMIELTTFILVFFLGGFTVYFQDDMLIKWKVTIINWLFGIILIISTYLQKPIIQKMIGKRVKLPKKIWHQLNNTWGLFFLFLGTINLIIAYNFPTNIWVNFKFFGILGMTFTFIMLQVILLKKTYTVTTVFNI